MDSYSYSELDRLIELSKENPIRPPSTRPYVRTPIMIKKRTLSDSTNYETIRSLDSDDNPDSCPSSPISAPETNPSDSDDYEDGSYRKLNKSSGVNDQVSDNVSEGSYEDPDEALEKEKLMKIRLETLSNCNSENKQKLNHGLSVNLFSNIRKSVPGLKEFIEETSTSGVEQMNRAIDEYLNQSEPSDSFVMCNIDVTELSDIFKTLTCIKHMDVSGCKLKNLKNLPPNLERLDARNNELTELFSSEIPDNVSELHVSKNKITFVDLSMSPNIETLNISCNPLTNLLLFPPNINALSVASSCIDTTEPFKDLKFLKILKISSTEIDNLSELPDGIAELHATKIQLEKCNGIIESLPQDIEKFVANDSGIRILNFESFPPFLKYLDLSNNELRCLPELPEKLEFLDVSNNSLMCVVNVPCDARTLDYSHNSCLKFTSEQQNIIEMLRKYGNGMVVTDDKKNENIDAEFGRRFGLNSESDWDWINQHPEGFGNHGTNSTINEPQQEPLLFPPNNIPDAPDLSTSRTPESQSPCPNRPPLAPQRMYGGRGRGRGRPWKRGGPSVHFGPQNQKPYVPKPNPIPPHILKIMGSDTFCATKDSKREIKHKHVYTV